MNTNRRAMMRQETILQALNEKNFLSIDDLCELCLVSPATIRRDLETLAEKQQIERTHGGALSLQQQSKAESHSKLSEPTSLNGVLSDQVDVLIVTSVDHEVDLPILEQFSRKNKRIIAESLPCTLNTPVIAVDNYQAAKEMGNWAGNYVDEMWNGEAHILDLGYHLPNTQARCQGFKTGIREVIPGARVELSVNSESDFHIAYQLTKDALLVHPNINIIFAINDTNALGAIKACEELNIDPSKIMVIPFGLEGPTFYEILSKNVYCKAGVAMFPEIVGRTCIRAALDNFNGSTLSKKIITPHAILTAKNLPDFYRKAGQLWKFNWGNAEKIFPQISILTQPPMISSNAHITRIGFTVRYSAHEWYKQLISVMQEYANELEIEFEIIDLDQTHKHELTQRRNEIAKAAAQLVQDNSVILLDSGPIAPLFARELTHSDQLTNVTVISNSFDVLNILHGNANFTVISTGGVLRRNNPTMVGPIAEAALKTMRAEQVFLNISGISSKFGLSHDNISEVTMKKAMIDSAREVILLADHSAFRHESFIQFAPLTIVNKLITDESLPASFRLELNRLGIQIVVANQPSNH
jgi:DeoR family fructose operon transcriptional repressor